MSRLLTVCVVSLALANGSSADSLGSDPSQLAKFKTALVPRKSVSPQLRASLCVQKLPELALWDGRNKISPSTAGFMYVVEHNEGNRLLLSDLHEVARLKGTRTCGESPHWDW